MNKFVYNSSVELTMIILILEIEEIYSVIYLGIGIYIIIIIQKKFFLKKKKKKKIKKKNDKKKKFNFI